MFNQLIHKNRCFVIAEIGLSHEGSLGVAISMIDKAIKCGVDAVKFQTHFPFYESSKWEEFRVKGNLQDKTRYDYWQRTSFSEDIWEKLKKYCDEKNILFLSTPFSVYAAEILENLNIAAWKISSGDITNYPLLDFVSSTRKPIFLSTGMSNYSEVIDTVQYLKEQKNDLVVFQCTNSYPCPAEQIGLSEIKKLKKLLKVDIGFSDHSGKIGTGISAFTLGALALEVHVTWDKEYFGPDVSSSLTFEELKTLVDNIRYLEKSFKSKYNKNDLIKSHLDVRSLFMKGVYFKENLLKNHIIEYDNLSFKKPLTDIPASEYKSIIGKKLIKDVYIDNPVIKSDIKWD